MSAPARYSLLKRSNGFWYVLYKKDGRVRWKSTRTRMKPQDFGLLDVLDEAEGAVLAEGFTEDIEGRQDEVAELSKRDEHHKRYTQSHMSPK